MFLQDKAATSGLRFISDRMMQTKRTKNGQGFLVIEDCKLARSGILKYKAFEL